MKREFGSKLFWTVGLVFSLVLLAFSGSSLDARDEKVVRSRDFIETGRLKLPDLQVKLIEVTRKCELQVTIANIGAAGVPESCYLGLGSVLVQLFKGNILGSSIGLKVFDPLGKLKAPGGTATYVWPAMNISMGRDMKPPKIRAVVDPKNVLAESNETNNELTQEVICKAKASIVIYDVDPPKAEDMCWYRGEQNTYGILWKTVNYTYTTMQKITLTCIENWDQEPYVLCNAVTTIGNNMPNTGSFFFQLSPGNIHTGRYEIRVYGNGGVVSNVFLHCIF